MYQRLKTTHKNLSLTTLTTKIDTMLYNVALSFFFLLLVSNAEMYFCLDICNKYHSLQACR